MEEWVESGGLCSFINWVKNRLPGRVRSFRNITSTVTSQQLYNTFEKTERLVKKQLKFL